MSKLRYFIALLVVAGVVFSCGKDNGDNDDKPNPPPDTTAHPPDLSFKTGGNYVSEDFTIETSGGPFKIGIEAATTSGANLVKFKLGRYQAGTLVFPVEDQIIDSTDFEFDDDFFALSIKSTEEFRFYIMDADSNESQISLFVSTVVGNSGIVEYKNVELGSFASSTAQVFASSSGDKYLIGDVDADTLLQKKVDFAYFNDPVWGHTFMSPSNDTIAGLGIYPGVLNWDFRNESLFSKTSLTGADYDDVTYDVQLTLLIKPEIYPDIDFVSEKISLPIGISVGDILSFESAKGKLGIIKITEINAGASVGLSTIKFDMKIKT